MLERLLRNAEIRGKDATGVCFTDPQRGMVIVKDGKPAREFLRDNKEYEKERENFPAIVLGHKPQRKRQQVQKIIKTIILFSPRNLE